MVNSDFYPRPKIVAYVAYVGMSSFSIDGYEIRPPQGTGSGFGYYVETMETHRSGAVTLGVSRRLWRRVEVGILASYDKKSYTERLDSIRFTTNSELESLTFVSSDRIRNQYLSVHVLPQYVMGRKFKCNLGVGGYVARLIASRTEVVQSSQPFLAFNSAPGFNTYGYGASVNVGASYPLRPGIEATIQLFANQGISSVSDFRQRFGFPAWRYRSLTLVVGLKFINPKHKNV